MNLPTNRVMRTQAGLRCPHCGPVAGAEYQQQDPAPCGCAWVWECTDEGTVLVSVPSMADVEM